jgi:hypothetical protein
VEANAARKRHTPPDALMPTNKLDATRQVLREQVAEREHAEHLLQEGQATIRDLQTKLAHERLDRILRGQSAERVAFVRFVRPPISVSQVEKATQGLAAGKGVRQVARLAGISEASVSRIKSASVACFSC